MCPLFLICGTIPGAFYYALLRHNSAQVLRREPGRTHEEKLKEINRAFSPFPLRLTLITQADGLGWDSVAPLALGFAGTVEAFSA